MSFFMINFLFKSFERVHLEFLAFRASSKNPMLAFISSIWFWCKASSLTFWINKFKLSSSRISFHKTASCFIPLIWIHFLCLQVFHYFYCSLFINKKISKKTYIYVYTIRKSQINSESISIFCHILRLIFFFLIVTLSVVICRLKWWQIGINCTQILENIPMLKLVMVEIGC